MSFQPIISISSVPRNSASFVFTDITGNSPTNPTGFGATNAPASRSDITSLWADTQPYGGEPIQASAVTGLLTGDITATVTIADGVQWLAAYYGQLKSLSFTVSTDRKTLTTSDGALIAKMDSVVGVGISNTDFPITVSSVTSTTIVLEAALPGTASSYTQIYTYWKARIRVLVLNCADSVIGNAISKLPRYHNDERKLLEIFNKIALKLGAQYAFNCGNYSEANESAKMICGSANLPISNCTTCG